MKKSITASVLLLAVLVLGACTDPDNPLGLEEAYGAIPYTAHQRGFTFYPDGYGLLSYVTYYPIYLTDVGNSAWATNSDGAQYGGLTWSFSTPDASDYTGTATLRFDYPNGDYEIYTLHNLVPPTGYRGAYYYEYEGYTGGYTYVYDGSWDLDADLNNTQGLIAIWTDSGASTADLNVNGTYETTLYGGDYFVKKVLFGDYTVTIDYSDSSMTDYTATPTIASYTWYVLHITE